MSLVAAAYGLLSGRNNVQFQKASTSAVTSPAASSAPSFNQSSDALLDKSNAVVDRAYEGHARDVQVEGRGVVLKVLHDDEDGSRHQKFLLRLPSSLTVLIAHNIDLAPRIEDLRAGDSVEFNGDYEWNAKGGIVHWTHHDPAGRPVSGWLKRKGRIYQ